MPQAFAATLTDFAKTFEPHLESALAHGVALPRHNDQDARLKDAMCYALMSGGKRIRPFLLYEAARLCGYRGAGVWRAAVALECVHCYSLAHDDLPAMDNDDLRRGKPTVHRAFDEATALLAGNALLTLAFELLATDETTEPAIRLELISLLTKASGGEGMIGGQMLDLRAEGRFRAEAIPYTLDEASILELQAMKSGALLRFALEAGALLAQAAPEQLLRLRRFGERMGLAFQLRDDLLDAEGDAQTLGKATQKDHLAGKGTLIGLWGLEKTRAHLATLIKEAKDELAPFAPGNTSLLALADFMQTRQA